MKVRQGVAVLPVHPVLDSRLMDGFRVRFAADNLIVTYHGEVLMKEIHPRGQFENEIERKFGDIASYLKKEYKKITGNSVTLTAEGEVDIRVENSSRVRSWVTAAKHYRVGGLQEDMGIQLPSENTVEAGWKDFLGQGGWGERPPNDTSGD